LGRAAFGQFLLSRTRNSYHQNSEVIQEEKMQAMQPGAQRPLYGFVQVQTRPKFSKLLAEPGR